VLRLAQADSASVPGVTVRVVQPALTQLQKWKPADKDEVLASYFRLSSPEADPLRPGTVLVWPESAFPYPLVQDPGALAAIAELLPDDTSLVTGAYREELPPSGNIQYYNSIYVIGDDGTVEQAYDKVHLVPLGEYVPARDFLNRIGLRQLTDRGFVPGPRRRPLDIAGGASFAPLICYEIIFPGDVLGDGPRPDFLLNVTNDGWFGRTTGPYQHLHQARVRGVEEGLPLVRAANTGISAVFDSYGRSVGQARLGEATMIEAALPTRIPAPLYAQWRDIILALSMAVCILIATTKILYRASAI
jgi:apolipoprotein N-acyltransferase